MNLWKLGLPTIAALAILAGCGGDDDDDGPTPGVGETLPAGETPQQEDTVFDVVAVDFAFDPNRFEASAGEVARINFTNEGLEDHTMTIYRDAEFSEPLEGATTGVEEGIQTFTFLATFDEAGTYHFRCDFHPTDMTGEIEVQ